MRRLADYLSGVLAVFPGPSFSSGNRALSRERILFGLLFAWAGLILMMWIPRVGEVLGEAAGTLAAADYPVLPGRFASAMVSHALTILAALAFAAAFALPGAGVLRWLKVKTADPVFRICAAFPLGYAFVSFLMLGLLLVRLWFPWLLWSALAVSLMVGGRQGVRALASDATRLPKPSLPAVAGWISLALFLPWLVAPELHTDGYEYFLAGPATWLGTHGLYVRHMVSAAHYPSLLELPYSFALLAGNDAIPKWWHLIWMLCGIGALGAVRGGGSWGWGFLGLLSCATMTKIVGLGKNDGAVIGLALLSYTALRTSPSLAPASLAPGSSRVVLAGIFAGLACCVKYVGALNVVWVPLAVLALNRTWWRPWAVTWAALAVGLGVPWYLKSYLLTGDPFWPALSGLVPGIIDGWDARNAEVWRNWLNFQVPDKSFLAGFTDYLGSESGAFLWALPVALALGAAETPVIIAGVAVCAVYYQAFLNPQIYRWFLATLAPAVFLSFAASADQIRSRTGRGTVALKWMLAGFLLLATIHRTALQFRNPNVLPFLVGAQDRVDLVGRALGTYDEAAKYFREAGSDRATLAVGEIRSYRMPRPFLVGTTINIADAPLMWKLAFASGSPVDLRKKLRQLDVRRILHNPMRAQNSAYLFAPFVLTDRMLSVLEGFFRSWTEPVYLARHAEQRNGMFFVYRVLDVPRTDSGRNLYTLPGCETELVPGLKALQRRDAVGAIDLFEKIHARLPGVYQVADLLAYSLRLARRSQGAYDLYRPGATAGMVDDVNVFDYAWSAYETKRFEEAIGEFEKAVEIYPDLREKTLICLHGARLAAISAAARKGRMDRATALANAGLVDALLAGTRARPRYAQWMVEYRVALAVADALRGRRDDAKRALEALVPDAPWLKDMPLDNVIKLFLP